MWDWIRWPSRSVWWPSRKGLGVALSEEELLTCDTVGELEAAIAAKYRDE